MIVLNVYTSKLEMVALDCCQFSLVKDEGFTCLLREFEPLYPLPSRRYFIENIVTNLF